MSEPLPSSETDFDRAIALSAVGEGHLRAAIQPGWDIRGVPNGGYLLAMMAAAAKTAVPQPDPLSVSATYLAPPDFAVADLTVTVARVGRRQSTVTVRLLQDDRERVRATMTLGTLPSERPHILAADAQRPTDLTWSDTDRLSEGQDPIALRQRVEVRLADGVGFPTGQPSGRPRLDGRMRFVNGREPDPLALLLFSDGFPPSIFEARGIEIGHVPTVQLTTHLFGLPAPGWVQGRFRTRVQGGGFVDEDGELWDSEGRLVATTRQLALLR